MPSRSLSIVCHVSSLLQPKTTKFFSKGRGTGWGGQGEGGGGQGEGGDSDEREVVQGHNT